MELLVDPSWLAFHLFHQEMIGNHMIEKDLKQQIIRTNIGNITSSTTVINHLKPE